MSESVKIGGIGKNPAIDQIQQLNAIDVGSYAVKRMQEFLLQSELSGEEDRDRERAVDFGRVHWKRTGAK